jgi:hypothetical protein
MAKLPLYPEQVEVDEAKVKRVVETFKTAYKSIIEEISTATDFGVANRQAILGQIEVILFELGADVQQLVSEDIPEFYTIGADQAVRQLRNVGAEIGVSEGFNRVHQEAIAALVDDTAKAFAESMVGVGRSANLLLGKATRDLLTQQMAKGIIGGEALRTVRLSIKGILQEQGLSALVDKGGRRWTLDRYADMLYRTKVTEARNRAMANRMVENGYDLVQVSSHDSSHQECRVWEGKVLSITGQTKGYPTLAEAEMAGLFHPNCKHAINVLIPSIAKQTRAYDRQTGGLSEPGSSFPESANT